MAGFNPKWIVGKIIASVDMRTFECDKYAAQRTAHDPIITFTDGSDIQFVTQETGEGEYGTQIIYRKARGD